MPKFLFKANNTGISHCTCENEPAMSTGQMDCPWCGCGWLISCSKCRKAYTYGEIRHTDIPVIELGRREVIARGLTSVTDAEIAEWADAMVEEFDRFELGQMIVYFDGHYFDIHETGIKFDGYFAKHDLKTLPHFDELANRGTLYETLTDSSYWLDRELPDRE